MWRTGKWKLWFCLSFSFFNFCRILLPHRTSHLHFQPFLLSFWPIIVFFLLFEVIMSPKYHLLHHVASLSCFLPLFLFLFFCPSHHYHFTCCLIFYIVPLSVNPNDVLEKPYPLFCIPVCDFRFLIAWFCVRKCARCHVVLLIIIFVRAGPHLVMIKISRTREEEKWQQRGRRRRNSFGL